MLALGEARVQKQLDRLGGLDVIVAEHAVFGAGLGEPEQLAHADDQTGRYPCALLDLPCRVPGAEHPLDREQREPVLGRRRMEFLVGESLLTQTGHQAPARGAALAVQSLQ